MAHHDIDSLLREKGIAATRPRRIIADALLSRGGHVGAEELHALVRGREPGISLATVYRTLKTLTDTGIVVERDFGQGRRAYEGAGSGHHDHLICLGCGEVVEFDVPEIERLQTVVVKKYGFIPAGHRMDLYGWCPRCREDSAGAPGSRRKAGKGGGRAGIPGVRTRPFPASGGRHA